MAANVYASATEDDGGKPWTSGSVTIDCPDVGTRLTDVPQQAGEEVDRELANLDQQIAAAYRQLQDSAQSVREDAGFADNAVMNPLKEKRAATIERISIAIDRVGDRPQGLEEFAACTLRTADDQAGEQGNGEQGGGGQDQGGQNQGDQGQGQNGQQGGQGGQDQGQNGGGQQGNGGQAGNGPVAADYVDIKSVQPGGQGANPASGPSRGTFATSCGVNENGLFNSDNVIVAPGVTNGAHHFHDYVGNQSNDAFASDEDLANAQTSCVDQDDKSSYFWPVIRLQNGTQENDANSPGGGVEGNAGEIVTPKAATMTFVGNAQSKVTEMPRLLRIITGDAKAFVNGPVNANASWSCTGFEDRQVKDKYPLCPQGSDVVRTFRFQSCWDGSNIDSANHRTHVAFAAADGSCANGFKAIPQLVQRIVYDIDAPSLADGGRTTPLFAVDSFPEQLHKPVTDHGDFINVFGEDLMREMVSCINEGRTCGAGTGGGDNGGGDNGNGGGDDGNNGGGNNGGGNGGNGGNGGGDNGAENPPAQSPEPPADGGNDNGGNDNGNNNGGNGNGGNNNAGGDTPVTQDPKIYDKPSPKASAKADTKPGAGAGNGGKGEVGDAATAPPEQSAAPAGQDDQDNQGGQEAQGDQGSTTPVDDTGPQTQPQTQPQAVGGSLAETGAQLWPAAAGALLLIGGFVLLRRTAFRKD
ncbi:DUF1996 domain-containing protein [Streptomyces antibioticus]|uniref:DUF1996 domain-containing protein n=1 Tax=Streptomyces antibioticus TaxID=1890 RepID=UPI0036B1B67E